MTHLLSIIGNSWVVCIIFLKVIQKIKAANNLTCINLKGRLLKKCSQQDVTLAFIRGRSLVTSSTWDRNVVASKAKVKFSSSEFDQCFPYRVIKVTKQEV